MTEQLRTMPVVAARTNLSELLGEVFYTGQPIVIERHGKPMAVVINPDTFARFRLWQAQQRSNDPLTGDADGQIQDGEEGPAGSR